MKVEKELAVGDEVWFPVKHDGKPHFGTVTEIYMNDSTEPAVAVIDRTNGGYRVAPIRLCFETEAEVKAYKSKERLKIKALKALNKD